MNDDVFEKHLADEELNSSAEFENELQEVLSHDPPDLDKADRLVGRILAERGENPRKIDVSQALAEIRSISSQEQFADEVKGVDVISGGKRSRRGIRTLLYGAAAAALIVGCVAAMRHLGGRVPVRDETPPEIISQITTTVYNTDKAAVTTSAFDGNTENENIEVIVQTTAPAEQNPVKTEAKRETDPAENNIPQQTETVQTSPVQEQTMALTTTFCEGNQIHTTTTTTTADANDNSGEYVFSLTVSVVDYDTKEAIPGVSVKLIKLTSADDVLGIFSFNEEAIENGRYTVIDEWTTSKEPLHNIPTFNAGGYDDIYGYFFWISDLPADYYTPTDNYPEKDDYLYGDYKMALLAGTTDFEFGLRHIEEFQLEGTYSADISIVDYYGNYLAGIECSLREVDTGKEVAAWTTGESAFHVEGLEYSFETIKSWSSSKHYMICFKYQNGKYKPWAYFGYNYYDQLNGKTNKEVYLELDDEESPLYTGAVQ